MAPRKIALASAVNKALDATTLEAEDVAVMQLAKHYAAAIDRDAGLLKKLGPELMATLAELRLTPRARNAIVRGGPLGSDGSSDKIDELRSRRQRRAADMDAATA